MNHPSFYEHGYIDSQSSDSSNTTIPISLINAKTIIHSQPLTKLKQKKKLKATGKNNNKVQKQITRKRNKTKKVIQQNNDFSDYLILGDQYYIGSNFEQITKRLISKEPIQQKRIMQDRRILNKQKKCISKIQKYIKTFQQNLRLRNLIHFMSRQEKLQLYEVLKGELAQEDQINETKQLFNQALYKLQCMFEKLLEQYPQKKEKLVQWKNLKLHQLNTANIFFNKEYNLSSLLNFQEEMIFLEEECFFPEIRSNIRLLKADIAHFLQHQKQQKTLEYDAGIIWVLDKLQSFILQNHEIIEELSERIIQGQDPLLDNHLFIEFEKEIVGCGQDEEEAQTFNYIHIFNKAIFDLINQTAKKTLPYIQKDEFSEVLREIFIHTINSNQEQQLREQQPQALISIAQHLYDYLLEEAIIDFIQSS